MVNSRIKEYEFIISILNSLIHKYKDHNDVVLQQLVDIVKYRLDSECKTIEHRAKRRKDK